MKASSRVFSGWSALTLLVIVAVAAVVYGTWLSNSTEASPSVSQKGPRKRGLPNYDIREDKHAVDELARFRASQNKTAAAVADVHDELVAGESALKSREPDLKIVYNRDLKVPEVIGPDVKKGRRALTGPSNRQRSSVLKDFLRRNKELVGARASHIDKLKVRSEYQTPSGLSFVELRQEVNGVPVFRGEAKAAYTSRGEMIRVINNLAPALEETELSTNFGNAAVAAEAAYRAIEIDIPVQELGAGIDNIDQKKVVFGEGESATTAEKIYFPTEPGVAVPAWRVLIWTRGEAYYVIVDAHAGTMLWRKNITDDQTEPVTYSVYANPTAMMNVAQSPFPFWPGPGTPNGVQGAAITRSSVTRIGNEAPYTFNQRGWITDGGTKTDGNNVQAGLDRDGTDGIDANSEAVSANRNFTFNYEPFSPHSMSGDTVAPSPQTYPGNNFQQGIVTQLFYITNWYHDEMYRLGFTEAAGNFQHVNFTGQGSGGDRIRAEAQDLGTGQDYPNAANNANFTTPADGGRGRMQMYMWNRTSPFIDGSLDAGVVVHELTHGLSNRLHGNATGLTHDMSRGMGEGWSDFYGMALLSSPTDPIDGIYTTGSYVMFNSPNGFTNNAYYGIRRFPTAVMSSVGPNGKPHNPLTFADIDQTKFNVSDGAFAPRNSTNFADQVHRAGEVWSQMLWEVRARFITRLGWEVGNRRILQMVTDAMKIAPLSPTFIDERDALVAIAVAGGDPNDVSDVWAGFAARGLGASASIQNIGGTSLSGSGTGTTRVTEAFDLPNITQTRAVSVSDVVGDNDGFAEPGEPVTMSIPLTNATGRTAEAVALQLAGGGTADYGTLSGIANATQTLPFTVPTGSPCGATIPLAINVTSSLGATSFVREVFIGKPGATTTTENFDGVTAPELPAGWTATALQGGINFVSSAASPQSAPNSMFALDPTTVGGGTDLTSPPVIVNNASATVAFGNKYLTEAAWDGGVLEISINGGAYQDIIAAGGSFTQGGYNGRLGAGANNPLSGRAGWTGNSGSGYITTVAQFPASAAGKIVRLRWRFGADDNTAPANGGWNIDNVVLSNAGFVSTFECSYAPPTVIEVSITGRVTSPDGRPVRGASISIADSGNGEVRRVLANSLGFYRFNSVLTGRTYLMSVTSKTYRFSSRSISPTADLADVNFTGLE